MAWSRTETAWLKDAALVAVTAGLWFVWWAWRENHRLRKRFPEKHWWDNAACLLVGGTLGTVGSLVLLPMTVPLLSLAGILTFALGLYVLTSHIEDASRTLGMRTSDAGWQFPTAVAAAFIGVEIGNSYPEPALRAMVLIVLAALPYLYYRTHRDAQRVRAHLEGDREDLTS